VFLIPTHGHLDHIGLAGKIRRARDDPFCDQPATVFLVLKIGMSFSVSRKPSHNWNGLKWKAWSGLFDRELINWYLSKAKGLDGGE
jgi:glyoxylase-like metal-dependent hydrolase (beta-lactamase superfamily II)